VVMSKRWLATLPPDLLKIVREEGTKTSKDLIPWVLDFVKKQDDIWKGKGGVLNKLPPDEQKAMLAKVSTIGEDLSKDKPELNKAVKMVFEVSRK
jgi:TRAP-type C4-dicarboxylate transport system substrate-binding protein